MAEGPAGRTARYACLIAFGLALTAACSREPADTRPAAPPAGPVSVVAARSPAPAIAASPVPASPFAVKGVLAPDQPLRHGDYVWEEDGVADGARAIVVDLKAQILYVYRGGIEIGRAAILYGADDKPTPTGAFAILEKDADHVSNLYGVPMPNMLRLTWDGIAIHGSSVDYGSATHGCVGVPDEFAAMLFSETKVGDRVLITKAWRTDVYGA